MIEASLMCRFFMAEHEPDERPMVEIVGRGSSHVTRDAFKAALKNLETNARNSPVKVWEPNVDAVLSDLRGSVAVPAGRVELAVIGRAADRTVVMADGLVHLDGPELLICSLQGGIVGLMWKRPCDPSCPCGGGS